MPVSYTHLAKKIREDSEVLVVAGIGGSYLGARAVIEAVKGLYHNELEDGPKIYFCGNSISPSYLNDIIALCKGCLLYTSCSGAVPAGPEQSKFCLPQSSAAAGCFLFLNKERLE